MSWPNEAHWHLIVNHAPIFGFAFAFLVLALSEFSSCSAWRKVGWFLAVVSTAALWPAAQTGEGAAALAKKLDGVSVEQIQIHEEKAQLAVWCGGVTGALALLAFAGETLRQKCLARPFRWIILLGIFSSLVFFGSTAYEGAKIRHPEIELR